MTSENEIINLLTHRRGCLFREECIALELRPPNSRNIPDVFKAIDAAKRSRHVSGTD